MDIGQMLNFMVQKNASDLFLSVGAPPCLRVDGESSLLEQSPLSQSDLHTLAYSVMNDRQQREFEATMEMNLAFGLPEIGRFRVSVYRQRGAIAMAVRYITSTIPTLEALHLPAKLKELVMLPRGLVLVVGAAGSGKSTTLASMIDYRNSAHTGHILTIEDPIEYVHQHKKSVVDQREIGLDTLDYASALKNAMRQAPDAILIGEIRDAATMQHAIAYAETGHLCLSTLHANNANQALERIVNFFPENTHRQLLMDLALNLRAVISLRLLRATDGKRVPAVELLLQTPYIAELIQKGAIDKIKEVMAKERDLDMQTFDDALHNLYASGKISAEEALEHADSRSDLSLRIRLGHGSEAPGDPFINLDD